MTKEDRIFVAGSRGLVGSALIRRLQQKGYRNLLVSDRTTLDLSDEKAVFEFYQEHRPTVVFAAAAKVGGILANSSYRADFIYQNLQIQNNVIWGAHQVGVRRLVFLGSSCIYPRNAPQPIKENYLLKGELEFTNRPYALAKIAGLELIHSLRLQYKRDYFSAMPTNLYGPGDNYNSETAHVLPALVRKFVEAKQRNNSTVQIWGTGTPLREFLHSDDCADAIIHLAETLSSTEIEESEIGRAGWSHINIGSGEETSIRRIAEIISKIVDFRGTLEFDTNKPDGTPRKLLDSSFLRSQGWNPNISLERGLRSVIENFTENLNRL